MSLSIANLTKRLFRRFTKKPTTSALNRAQLHVTPLEDRTVPSTVTVAALADATEGVSDGTFRFSRDGDTSQPLTIFISVSGASTATPGQDFSPISSQVTFAAQSATADVVVDVTGSLTTMPPANQPRR